MADIELVNRSVRQDESTTTEPDIASAVPLPALATSSLERLRIHRIATATELFSTPAATSIGLSESVPSSWVQPVRMNLSLPLATVPRSRLPPARGIQHQMPAQPQDNHHHLKGLDVFHNRYCLEQIERFRLAAKPTSTAAAITSWLIDSKASADPLAALLEVVDRDSVGFFDSLEICLKEIREDSLDDYLMSQRLSDWRRLMSDFETSVAEINKSLQNFVAFAFEGHIARPNRVDFMLTDLDARNAQFAQRVEKAYNALRAEMRVFESLRSVAEAETVTKLTELAFLSLPLTFCCGLYNMQVNESRDGVPLITFVITAVIVFVLCDGARLVLRSTIVTESGQIAREILWAQGRIKPETSIPARQFVWLTMREAWRKGGNLSHTLSSCR